MRMLDGPGKAPTVYASQLEALFDATTMATALCRFSDGRFLLANQRCKTIFHLTDEMIDQGVTTATIGLITAQRNEVRALLEKNSAVREVEMTYERPGHENRVLLAAFRLVIIDGECCVVSNFLDITRRRSLSRELQEAQDQMRQFLDLAPASISLKRPDGHMLWVNKSAVETFGFSGEKVTETTNFDIWSEEIATRLTAVDQRVFNEQVTVREEVELLTDDGEPLVIDMVKFPVTDTDNNAYAIGTIGTDITERRKGEMALRESEARLRQLASSMDGVWILWQTNPLEILYVSPAVAQLMGVPADQVTFETLLMAVHPDDREAVQGQVLESDTWDGQMVRDFRTSGPDGEIRWIRTRTSKVTEAGSTTRRSTILIDVTDWKVAAAELEAARSIADRSSNAKNEFLSRMSHELRTPLHSILGFGQLLESEPLTVAQRAYSDQIARAGVHLLRLIDEVLDISQIESGHMRLNMEELSLLSVMTDTLELVEPAAQDVECTVSVVSDLAGTFVVADRTRLKQVLLNVVSNAIKYNSVGGRVTISLEANKDQFIRLNIDDDGVGIASDVIGRLFEPFDRLGAEATRIPGTGLGLALARQLMELMGGSIGAVSNVGVGSRFWLDLVPAVGEAQPNVEKPIAAIGRPGISRGTTDRPSRVLVVENDPASVALLEAVLRQRSSIIATFARTGEEGLFVLLSEHVDFVLLDMHLPDMSGCDLLARMSDEGIGSNTQVVVLSADAVSSTIERALSLGAAAYLTKPFDVAELWGVLDNLTIRATEGLSFLYADDDDLCRRFMVHLFERYLPSAHLSVAASGAEALQKISANPPDILLLDIHLRDMSGLEVMDTLRGQPTTRRVPIVLLSADARQDWVDTQLTTWLGKPFTVNEFLHLVASLAASRTTPG